MSIYVTLKLKEKVTVTVLGIEKELMLSDLADGCVGCLLAFKDTQAASDWAGDGKVLVVEKLEAK